MGAGPAGRALTHRLLTHGCTVALVDPRPVAPWQATYGCWTDELPEWMPADTIAAETNSVDLRSPDTVVVERGYTVLDVDALQAALDVDGAEVIADRAIAVQPDRVTLRSDAQITAGVVIDARGLSGRGPRQTAFGRIVPRAQAVSVLDGAEAVLMDWTAVPGLDRAAPPSFLYVIPLDDERVLLEETCLAGDPPLSPSELRTRLDARLVGHTLTDLGDETVSFGLLGQHSPWRSDVTLFGARGGLMHPATGYSVAASLRAAEPVAIAIAAQEDPHRTMWPRSARQVYRLRRAGLRSLLALDATQTRRFFATFAQLPVDRQRAYLSEREDLSGVMRTMTQLFAEVGGGTRGALMRSVLGR
ncbi:lycopene cyclase family protein [Gordonia sp. CPCC 205515]|uniref:lycopene cyclase family protein n=1 Tax=Gordonia sp. CPCC 205515 TaxID=3140791 RepID=UPI003AF3A8A2